uniref:Uncharacterized protein n=1 Tax=Spongospora subterranea TaxID=70186 RepID=A0A0H5R0V2_9EUKA|eukprot:CRZ07815.1 hypothetical protein [Spongospora subterranea]
MHIETKAQNSQILPSYYHITTMWPTNTHSTKTKSTGKLNESKEVKQREHKSRVCYRAIKRSKTEFEYIHRLSITMEISSVASPTSISIWITLKNGNKIRNSEAVLTKRKGNHLIVEEN